MSATNPSVKTIMVVRTRVVRSLLLLRLLFAIEKRTRMNEVLPCVFSRMIGKTRSIQAPATATIRLVARNDSVVSKRHPGKTP